MLVHGRSTWKNKEHHSRGKDNAEKWYDLPRHIQLCIQYTKKWRYTIHYVKRTAHLLFKSRFPKGGPTCRASAWLVHDTKRRKDNQLQSLKLPCRISKNIHEWIPPTLAVRECCDIFQDLLCYFELRHLDNRKLSQISKRNCDDKMNEKCLLMS